MLGFPAKGIRRPWTERPQPTEAEAGHPGRVQGLLMPQHTRPKI